jgi:hypothetical protein
MNTLPFSEHRIKITDLVAEWRPGGHQGREPRRPHRRVGGRFPTGKSWTNRGMGLTQVHDGKITEFEFIFDELGHLKQLGASITPPSGRE